MKRHIAAWILASLALAGCYAEIEDKDVTIKRSMPICDSSAPSCVFQGLPAGLQAQTPIAVAGGATDFTLDLGDEDVLRAQRKEGPVELKGNLKVNRAVLAMGTGGASFAGVTQLRIVQLPFATSFQPGSTFDPCANEGSCPTVASYDRDRDGPAEDELVLKGSGVNLLALSDSQVTLRFVASGILPSVDWSALLTLDAEFSARASFP